VKLESYTEESHSVKYHLNPIYYCVTEPGTGGRNPFRKVCKVSSFFLFGIIRRLIGLKPPTTTLEAPKITEVHEFLLSGTDYYLALGSLPPLYLGYYGSSTQLQPPILAL
jgi:hypothetical protein